MVILQTSDYFCDFYAFFKTRRCGRHFFLWKWC